MTHRRMLLIAHTGRPEVDITARKVAATLAAAGIELITSEGERRELGLNPFEPADQEIDTANGSVEIVLAIGGDGTLLRAAEQARPLTAPILGINRGRVGFLTEVDVDHVDAALQAIIDQRYRVSSRMTVQVSVEHEGEFVTGGWALNEISVEKITRERILDVVVEVDGHGVSAYG